MYIPGSFEQTDRAALGTFVRRNSFALLVSQSQNEPFATHLPLLADLDASPGGELLGHMARANPQWRDLAGQQVLAIFSGPHAYVSPTWYEAENVVPTWNYLAVHVYGRCELVEDEEPLLGILAATTATYESSLPRPWQFNVDDHLIRKLLPAIVGFRITIDRIEGKWKLGQNHPEERRRNAARHLAEQGDPQSDAIARLMLETCQGEERPR